MDVNQSSPVVVQESISVDASAECVWNILVDFENWPNWNRGIKSVRIEGPIVEGTRFSWKARPGTIHSQLKEIHKPGRIVWAGKILGINAIHVWEIIQTADKTTATTKESWDGFHVRLLKKFFYGMLKKSIHTGLENLKREAEKN